MSTLKPDDLFLVNRERESYTITYEELSEQLGSGITGIIQVGLNISADPDNYVGTTLTATGGQGFGPSGALTPTYQWRLDDVDINGATSQEIEAVNPGTYTCVATLVDGNLTESTASNELVIEARPGIIDKPSILLPVGDGGTLNPGVTTYLISDTIIDVEGGGIDVCETDAIQNVVGAFDGRTWTGNPVDPNNFFDGNPDTRTAANAGASATATFAAPVKISSIYLLGRSPQNNHTISVNTDVGDVPLTYTGDWADSSISPSYPGQWFADGFTEINSITFSDSGNLNWTIAGFQEKNPVNGTNLLKDGDKVLTFPSNNNFDCFEPDDVVQTDPKYGIEFTSNNAGDFVYSPDYFQDGLTTTGCQLAANSSPGVWRISGNPTDVILDLNINQAVGNRKIILNGTIDISDHLDTLEDAYPNGKEQSVDLTPLLSGKPLTEIALYSTASANSISLNRLVAHGVPVLTIASSAKIISKDADAVPPTITVDGGEWIGSDQEYGSWTGTFNPPFPATKAFDGVYATGDDVCMPANINDPCTWTGKINIPNGATVEMVYWNQDAGVDDAYFRINNQDISVVGTGTNTDLATVDITAQAGSQITKMEINRGEITYGGMGIGAILINGSAVTGSSYTDGGDTKLVKQTPYDTKLTVDSDKDLADMTGATFMSDGAGAPGPYSQTPYKLVTTDIESVAPVNYSDNVINTAVMSPAADRASINSFDGDENTWAQTSGQDATNNYFLTYNFPSGLKINQQLRVWAYSNTSEQFANLTFADNSTDRVNIPHTAGEGSAERKWVTLFTGSKTLSKIDVERKKTGNPSSQDVIGYAIIEVDGVALLDGQQQLTFPGDVSTNPDLRYFKQGDEVQSGVTVISNGYDLDPKENKLVVDGGEWATEENSGNSYEIEYTNEEKTVAGGPLCPESAAARVDFKYNAAGGSLRLTQNGAPVNFPNTFTLRNRVYQNGYNNWTISSGSTVLAQKTNGVLSGAYVTAGNMPPTSPLDFSGDADYQYQEDLLFDVTGLNVSQLDITVVDGLDGSSPYRLSIHRIIFNNQIITGSCGGDTHVEYQTNGGEGEIVSVNTDDNTLLIANTGDRDNRWIVSGASGNKAETDFFVAGPTDVDNLLTADIEFKCTDFSTTPSNADTWKSTRWELDVNGSKTYYDVDNETTWKPGSAILSPDTTYKVRVQHKGKLLDPSEQSGTVTIKTGASRNMYELVANRLTSLEAAEVADTAGDTALLTIITELANRVQQLEDGGN